uniref:NADH dehydrogenase [ubiquinone] 1 beta subcomplex subunit 5, mitochondrial n=1 Tax=Graphocephala atropunctata TaxID=36148 RepID=A0A1B6MCI3_9HEMI
MVVWSSFRLLNTVARKNDVLVPMVKRYMSGGHDNAMNIEVSRWQWHKFKDLVHYYFMVGAIPLSLICMYVNIFIGPAKLAEIPEGYTPKHWEYHRHPITRFIAQYLQAGYQQDYEKYMHYMFEEDEKAKMRRVAKEIKNKMAERHDYQAYYYRPVTAKYFRETREITQKTKEIMGEN